MDLRAALKATFGHDDFRPYQEAIIESVMEGRDTLGVLPTGAGKSLCYQFPAMLLPRPTLVVSPLIALMKDQLDGLPPEVYPQATLINSSVDGEELSRRLGGIEAGQYKLIYAAPERLRQQGFLRLLQRVGLSLLVVDEAHCVSVWGHDFRPDYLFIRKALDALNEAGHAPNVLALTATATPEMQLEIGAQLGRSLTAINAPMFRPNLRLEVLRCQNADDKMRRLVEVLRETPGAAIVYASSRDRCERLARFLNERGLPAAHYHAGLDPDTRRETQERFMLGKTRVIVATIAFGMGVDKANVRLVAHFSVSESLEAYTQEAGRAGRDGKPARCVLLYAPSDKTSLSRWLRQGDIKLATVRDVYRALQAALGKGEGTISPGQLVAQAFGQNGEPDADAGSQLRVAISLLERCGLVARQPDAGRDLNVAMLRAPKEARTDLEAILEARTRHAETRLNEIVGYVEGGQCRHATIARHFGQDMPDCGDACDVCLGLVQVQSAPAAASARPAMPTAEEVPDLGRAILQTIQSLPFPMGRAGLVKALVGATDSPVNKARCECFGCLAGFTQASLERATDRLLEEGYLRRNDDDEYRRLFVTDFGQRKLDSGEGILLNPNRVNTNRSASVTRQPTRGERPDATSAPAGEGGTSPAPAIVLTPDEDDRFEQLRAWRRVKAERQRVPPYVIFHDAVLREIARANPDSLEALSFLPGIGPNKLQAHGPELLELLHGAAQETTSEESDDATETGA